jgi:hypothetical protein
MLERAERTGFFRTPANVTHMATDSDFNAVREHEAVRRFGEQLSHPDPDASKSPAEK